jgi:toxin FitB
LLSDWFGAPLLLGAGTAARLPEVLSGLGVAGGAVPDALVGLAAVEHGASLATRDVRAKATYEIVGARWSSRGELRPTAFARHRSLLGSD